MDYLFQANNAVLIAAAAKGLRGCEEDVISEIGVKEFVRFLATPDAEEILSAVFRKCELRYWKNEKRVAWKTAYLPHGDLNVAVGPPKSHFDDKFHKEMELAAGVRSTITDKDTSPASVLQHDSHDLLTLCLHPCRCMFSRKMSD